MSRALTATDYAEELELVLGQLHTSDCFYFPVRHHSPACAWHVARLIRELRPATILVEGPESFTPLIPTILDPATKAPIAIYTHFVDTSRKLYKPAENEPDFGPARFAAYYPFCDYSPELVALRIGNELGARLRFIDLDYADQILAQHTNREQLSKPRVESLLEETHLQESTFLQALAQRSGCRDFNEMWDHLFEANFQSRSTQSFVREFASYCFFSRRDMHPELMAFDGTNAREEAMAAAIAEERERLEPGQKILVVTGGFHTVVLPQLVAAGTKSSNSQPSAQGSIQTAVIRYGFEQLERLNGYAAGMPSPDYYNRLWTSFAEGGPDPQLSVATALLVEIGALTRRKNSQLSLSTADEIAALQQAQLLASLRGHPGPTREDLLDGVRSCFVKGSMDAEGAVLMGLVSRVLTGKDIGDVPASAGVPPIVYSFRQEAERARLDISDSLKKRVSLEIYRRDNHRRTSRFLHCLNFLDVPFASLMGGPDFVRGTGLERIHEHWQYTWSPMTESALVDAAVYGSTIDEASANLLREAIGRLEEEGKGRSANAAVSMLIQACRMGLHRHVDKLLALIAARIAEEPSFVEAVGAANQLLLLWQSREPLEAHSLAEVPALLRASYLRSCYLVAGLAQCPEEALPATLNSLASVRELLEAASSTELLDEEVFWEAAAKVLEVNNHAHPCYSTICGAIGGLLFSAGRMDQTQLDELVVGYLIGITDSQKRVGFLHGLLKTCREVAWQNRQLVQSLDKIIASWDEEEFIRSLPSLRLALADLTPRETDKVASGVAALYGKTDLGMLTEFRIGEGELEFNRRLTAVVLETLSKDGLSHWLGERIDA